jgi:acetyl/propionyl-CoA carboxylase alpha subunit
MARYLVKVDDKEFDVEVEYRQKGHKVSLNGRAITASTSELGGSRSQLLIDHNSYEVDVRSDGHDNQRTVFMLGVEIPVEIEDYNLAQLRKTAGMSSGAAAAKQVKAPMPGLILEVKVTAGDKVTKGTPLVIIEAMKMENVIKAQSDGVVAEVPVEKGASVERHDILVEFE